MLDLTIAVPVILGVVQAFKGIGLPSKWASIVAIALGMLFFYFWGDLTTGENLFVGLVAGLSAAGLYSSVRAQM